MFAYCKNNPVNYEDSSGNAVETIFDIASVALSVADVVANPSNPWAWAGLVGDVIDVALPFVTGVGETIKAVGTSVRVISNTDNAVDAARALRKTADKADEIRNSVGAYVILYKDGTNYVGKGPFTRAVKSAIEHATDDNCITSIIWAPTDSDKSAFVAEWLLQSVRKVLSDKGVNTFNKIWSPGKNMIN